MKTCGIICNVFNKDRVFKNIPKTLQLVSFDV